MRFAAYPIAIRKVVHIKLRTGQVGRPRHVLWPDLHIVQVVKQHSGYHLTGIQRRIAHGCRKPPMNSLPPHRSALGSSTPPRSNASTPPSVPACQPWCVARPVLHAPLSASQPNCSGLASSTTSIPFTTAWTLRPPWQPAQPTMSGPLKNSCATMAQSNNSTTFCSATAHALAAPPSMKTAGTGGAAEAGRETGKNKRRQLFLGQGFYRTRRPPATTAAGRARPSRFSRGSPSKVTKSAGAPLSQAGKPR